MHSPVKRLVPGADAAVLFVHGILSTPRYWADFIAATPQNVSVHALLLPGHGGTVPDFGHVRWGAWQKQVTDAIAELCRTHAKVYVVAHSLGTLLTVNALADAPYSVTGLMFIAMPLHIRVKPQALIGNILKGVGLTENPESLASYYGTEQDWRIWRYISWPPRYLELFSQSAAARRNFPRLTIPAQVFMAPGDELVSMRSCRVIQTCAAASLTMLPASRHHTFGEQDHALLLSRYRSMCGFD